MIHSLSPLEDGLSFIMAWVTCSMISLLPVGSLTSYCSWQILDFLQGIYLITWPAIYKITLQLLKMFSVEILFTLCWKRTIYGRKVVFILGNVEFGNKGFIRCKIYMLFGKSKSGDILPDSKLLFFAAWWDFSFEIQWSQQTIYIKHTLRTLPRTSWFPYVFIKIILD